MAGDSSVGEWINLSLSSLSPGFNSRSWGSISRDFSLPDHTLPTRPEPAWQKMAQYPHQWHHKTGGNWGGRPKFNHRQITAEMKNNNIIAAKCSSGSSEKIVAEWWKLPALLSVEPTESAQSTEPTQTVLTEQQVSTLNSVVPFWITLLWLDFDMYTRSARQAGEITQSTYLSTR